MEPNDFRIFAANIDVALPRSHGVASNRRPLHRGQWIAPQNHAIFERPGLRLIRVTHHIVDGSSSSPPRDGASFVVLEKTTPDDILTAIEQYKTTVCFTAPTAYRAMISKLAGP